MSCGRRRAESCLARLLLVGWATPRGAAHVVCHGYPGSYTPQQPIHEGVLLQKPPHGSIPPRGAQARGQILGDRATPCPPKGQRCHRFSHKIGSRRVPSLDRVFINDLHEPSTCILQGLIQTHPDANPALGGSDPSASVMTSPTDVAMLALNQVD